MSTSASPPKEKPVADLCLLVDAFDRCKRKDGSLSTDHYLCAVNEMTRFFKRMSKGLKMAVRSAGKATKRLEFLRVSGPRSHYDSLDLMMQFEQEQSDKKTGTLALLMLHHTLHFMVSFLQQLYQHLQTDKTFGGQTRIQIYQDTLAGHHPRWLQAATKVLLAQAPSNRHQLLQRLDKSGKGADSALETVPRVISAASSVYILTQEVLQQFALAQ